ncbi:STAS domain-containing protein [Micromonospora sp. NPDC000442]|uniref:STAS domain-containing protein n=1 Tax=Micromonospora sp. NPDC000442 TaxID=3364217 RepID=UPI0036BC4411
MSDFQVRTATEADRIVVSVAGECDLRHRDELSALLHTAVQATSLVVVDLAAVRFLDSSGLHALVTARQAARQRAGNVYVVNATGTVARVLEMTGLLPLLQPPPPSDSDPALPPEPM